MLIKGKILMLSQLESLIFSVGQKKASQLCIHVHLCVPFVSLYFTPAFPVTIERNLVTSYLLNAKQIFPAPKTMKRAGIIWNGEVTYCRVAAAKWKCQARNRSPLFICRGDLLQSKQNNTQQTSHYFHLISLLCVQQFVHSSESTDGQRYNGESGLQVMSIVEDL